MRTRTPLVIAMPVAALAFAALSQNFASRSLIRKVALGKVRVPLLINPPE